MEEIEPGVMALTGKGGGIIGAPLFFYPFCSLKCWLSGQTTVGWPPPLPGVGSTPPGLFSAVNLRLHGKSLFPPPGEARKGMESVIQGMDEVGRGPPNFCRHIRLWHIERLLGKSSGARVSAPVYLAMHATAAGDSSTVLSCARLNWFPRQKGLANPSLFSAIVSQRFFSGEPFFFGESVGVRPRFGGIRRRERLSPPSSLPGENGRSLQTKYQEGGGGGLLSISKGRKENSIQWR